ncbi:GNAT family N-acetyltransferase [Streptomyces sp. 71268]|uniref:GNAT family N-acetyltransferase n=1 Tax=Streptomyces sp. 71268 TaxID=3002640 RepID=UPI0023F87FEA|nr:GNAT family N-acetyltransferase [Streptomyces sp. 71268]WEV27019.1 GNAT family N-acetyltransferase [Streptomyces sp. 71268]
MTSTHTSQDGSGGASARATDVRLRDVERADLELFFAFEQDPEAARRAVFPSRERERFMTHWENRVLNNPTVHPQTVLADGEVAGNFVCWEDEGRHLVGYWLGRPFWGRGIGGRALTQFLDLVEHRPLYADPFASNEASVRLLERCGFHRVPDPGPEHPLEPGQVLLVLER